jgi:hypothetical protein
MILLMMVKDTQQEEYKIAHYVDPLFPVIIAK